MKGDISRETFDPGKHYRSVRMQQGRVQLDSDQIEQTEITLHRIEREAADLIGGCGAPIGNDGFGITPRTSGSAPDRITELLISPGRFYADGILCENESETRYADQKLPPGKEPFFREGKREPGLYLAYLDVWIRQVTALEDESIRETALGGPDTTTRSQTVAQVKLIRVAHEERRATCATRFNSWEKLTAAPTGTLVPQFNRTTISEDPCTLPPETGYRRLGNYLYRVEVHDGGDLSEATFKWSRDNGSVTARWSDLDTTGEILTIEGNAVGKFSSGNWIELTDETHVLSGKPGRMVRIKEVRGETIRIDPATLSGSGTLELGDFPRTPIIRRWDGDVGLLNPTDGSPVELEGGLEVMFSDGTYRTGDYWLIPARSATNAIEWPEEENSFLPRSPRGVRHRYCRLALLRYNGYAVTERLDCRPLFPPVTRLTGLFYLGGDGQEVMPDPNPAERVELPERLRVGVANGEYPVEGATVRFRIVQTEGKGRLIDPDDPGTGEKATVDVRTDGNGVAECIWKLISDTNHPAQSVTATLLRPDGSESHLPIRFSAGLSIAGKVAYVPGNCDQLKGTTTVQQALDLLCRLTRGGCAITIPSNREKPQEWIGIVRDTLNSLYRGTTDRIPVLPSIHLCFQEGLYELTTPVEFTDFRSVIISGLGRGTRFVGTDVEAVFGFRNCESVTLRDFCAEVRKTVNGFTPKEGLNGVVTGTECGRVVIERLSLQSAPDTLRSSTCITVRNGPKGKDKPTGTDMVHITDCELLIGHQQTGILTVNSSRVLIENNRLQSAGTRPPIEQIKKDVVAKGDFRKLLADGIARVPEPNPGFAISTSADSTTTGTTTDTTTPATPGSTPASPGTGNVTTHMTDATGNRSLHVRIAENVSRPGAPNLSAAAAGRSGSLRTEFRTELRLQGTGEELTMEVPPILTEELQTLFLKNINPATTTSEGLLAEARRVVTAELKKAAPASSLGTWLENSYATGPAVALQGIVVGGEIAPEVRITGNSIRGVRQGVRVGLSRRETFSEFERGEPRRATMVHIVDNNLGISMVDGTKQERHGIFVGNADSVVVERNCIDVTRDGTSTHQWVEGVRIYGHLGPMVIVRTTHTAGATVGVRVAPHPDSIPQTRVWRILETLSTDAYRVWMAPSTVDTAEFNRGS